MLSKEEIEKAKEMLNKLKNYKVLVSGGSVEILTEEEKEAIKTLLQYIDQLEEYLERISKQLDNVALDQISIGITELQQENRNLKIELNKGVDKEKRYCFNEDGNTGKCLGYSSINDDEPCEYCKSCEVLSIKECD